jgi:hypothetical protein
MATRLPRSCSIVPHFVHPAHRAVAHPIVVHGTSDILLRADSSRQGEPPLLPLTSGCHRHRQGQLHLGERRGGGCLTGLGFSPSGSPASATLEGEGKGAWMIIDNRSHRFSWIWISS